MVGATQHEYVMANIGTPTVFSFIGPARVLYKLICWSELAAMYNASWQWLQIFQHQAKEDNEDNDMLQQQPTQRRRQE